MPSMPAFSSIIHYRRKPKAGPSQNRITTNSISNPFASQGVIDVRELSNFDPYKEILQQQQSQPQSKPSPSVTSETSNQQQQQQTPKLPLQKLEISPRIELDLTHSPASSDWFSSNNQSQQFESGIEGKEHPTVGLSGSSGPEDRRSVKSRRHVQEKRKEEAIIEREETGGDNNAQETKEYATSTEDPLNTLDVPTYLRNSIFEDILEQPKSSTATYKNFNPNFNLSISNTTRQDHQQPPLNSGLSYSQSRYNSQFSSPDNSAVSGTTFARVLLNNAFTGSPDSRSAHTSNGFNDGFLPGLTRSDSTTLPHSERNSIRYLRFRTSSSELSAKQRRLEDVPPVPTGAKEFHSPSVGSPMDSSGDEKPSGEKQSQDGLRLYRLRRYSSMGSFEARSLRINPAALEARQNHVFGTSGSEEGHEEFVTHSIPVRRISCIVETQSTPNTPDPVNSKFEGVTTDSSQQPSSSSPHLPITHPLPPSTPLIPDQRSREVEIFPRSPGSMSLFSTASRSQSTLSQVASIPFTHISISTSPTQPQSASLMSQPSSSTPSVKDLDAVLRKYYSMEDRPASAGSPNSLDDMSARRRSSTTLPPRPGQPSGARAARSSAQMWLERSPRESKIWVDRTPRSLDPRTSFAWIDHNHSVLPSSGIPESPISSVSSRPHSLLSRTPPISISPSRKSPVSSGSSSSLGAGHSSRSLLAPPPTFIPLSASSSISSPDHSPMLAPPLTPSGRITPSPIRVVRDAKDSTTYELTVSPIGLTSGDPHPDMSFLHSEYTSKPESNDRQGESSEGKFQNRNNRQMSFPETPHSFSPISSPGHSERTSSRVTSTSLLSDVSFVGLPAPSGDNDFDLRRKKTSSSRIVRPRQKSLSLHRTLVAHPYSRPFSTSPSVAKSLGSVLLPEDNVEKTEAEPARVNTNGNREDVGNQEQNIDMKVETKRQGKERQKDEDVEEREEIEEQGDPQQNTRESGGSDGKGIETRQTLEQVKRDVEEQADAIRSESVTSLAQPFIPPPPPPLTFIRNESSPKPLLVPPPPPPPLLPPPHIQSPEAQPYIQPQLQPPPPPPPPPPSLQKQSQLPLNQFPQSQPLRAEADVVRSIPPFAKDDPSPQKDGTRSSGSLIDENSGTTLPTQTHVKSSSTSKNIRFSALDDTRRPLPLPLLASNPVRSNTESLPPSISELVSPTGTNATSSNRRPYPPRPLPFNRTSNYEYAPPPYHLIDHTSSLSETHSSSSTDNNITTNQVSDRHKDSQSNVAQTQALSLRDNNSYASLPRNDHEPYLANLHSPSHTVSSLDSSEPTHSNGHTSYLIDPTGRTMVRPLDVEVMGLTSPRQIGGDLSPRMVTSPFRNQRARRRPPLPSGPRRPGQQTTLPSLGVASTILEQGTSVSSHSSSPSVSVHSRHGWSHLPAPRFHTPSPKWRGYTFETAKWTFTSAQLQSIVSRAIRESGDPSSIRLLRQETLETEVPMERHKLEMKRTEVKTKYKSLTRLRANILDSLSVNISSLGDESRQMALRQLEEVKEISSNLDAYAEALHSLDEQISQIDQLCQVHSSSALAVALRKLNSSFLKKLSENQALRTQMMALEEQNEEAWKQAEDIAQDYDLLIKGFDLTQPEGGGSSSGRTILPRKSSIRASKAGLRMSNSQTPSAYNSRRSSVASPTNKSSHVPPVPPVPAIPSSDLIPSTGSSHWALLARSSAGQSMGRPDSGQTLSSANSDARAMLQAQEELYKMLGLSSQLTVRRSQSVQDKDYSRRDTLLVPKYIGHRRRHSSLPSDSHIVDAQNALNVDRNAMLATFEALANDL